MMSFVKPASTQRGERFSCLVDAMKRADSHPSPFTVVNGEA